MNSIPPLSVCTTTKNSAPEIERLLESVEPIADEIVVLDSQSEDGTLDICEEYDAEVYQHEFVGFADLKQTAIDKARNEWVFIIDADEEVPENLRLEIERNLGRDGISAFYMEKSNVMFGDETHIDHPKRPYLAKKHAVEYKNEYMNETLSVKSEYEDQTYEFENKIIHHAYEDFDEYLTKWNQYSSLDALQAVDEDDIRSLWYYLFQGLAHWGYYIFKEKAFLDGRNGILFAFMSFQYQIVVWWKIGQLQKLINSEPGDWKDIWVENYCQR